MVQGFSRPESAGTGKTMIASAQGFVNLRTGPGKQYDDIGDIYNNTLVTYFPDSRTGDGWVWVEQRSKSGWVYTGAVDFKDVKAADKAAMQQPTPYDGKVAIWHWKGQAVPEDSIEELVEVIKTATPNVKQYWVKTSNGKDWQGTLDDKRALAVDSLDSIDRWVRVLESNGLELHAWSVPRGDDVEAEARIIADTCLHSGVKSMILDVEPDTKYYWRGTRGKVRSLMERVRERVPDSFHIGMAVDPRPWHYHTIFPEEWQTFVNSVHPMVYWRTFGNTPDEALEQTYNAWEGYGKPIVPILQGSADPDDMAAAHTLATQRYGARGVSWWRWGVIGPVEQAAVNLPVQLAEALVTTAESAEPAVVVTTNLYGDEQIVTPSDPGFEKGNYTDKEEFQSFEGRRGWPVYYKNTVPKVSDVWARWTPQLKEGGLYQVDVFIPKRHTTTGNARYKIHGVKNESSEVVVNVDQARNKDQWVSLGVVNFDLNVENVGSVFLNDVTGEEGAEIAFDAVRWRKVLSVDLTITGLAAESTEPVAKSSDLVVDGVYIADGYDSPIGTEDERFGGKLWPEGWLDVSPFGRLYFKGTSNEAYHTGADLNWGKTPDADKGLPVCAAASGMVVFAAKMPVWGNVIIVRHDPLKRVDGKVLYGRYAHVQNMMVTVGQRVKRGEQIAEVSDAFGRFKAHLHFDLSPTKVLKDKPDHWPKTNEAALRKHYIDPLEFIRDNRPSRK